MNHRKIICGVLAEVQTINNKQLTAFMARSTIKKNTDTVERHPVQRKQGYSPAILSFKIMIEFEILLGRLCENK